MPAASRLRALLRSERPFVVALAVGLAVRVLVQVGFPLAFVHSDGPTYLGMVGGMGPAEDRPVGYGGFLWLLSAFDPGVDFIAAVQHLLGLATGVVVYALLRRWSVSAGVATAATLPLLLDEMQLVLEHSVLSDVLFDLLLVVGIACLAWRRPQRVWCIALGGFLLGLATLVRIVGEPVVLVAAIFCLVVATTPRARVVHVLVVVAAFVAPLAAYATWYHVANGPWALTEASGRALYMRTTGFVDCSQVDTQVDLPYYERVACPPEPLGQRKDPSWYGWRWRATRDLAGPPGSTDDTVLGDFAARAIHAQPADYAGIVARDLAMGFAPTRADHYEYDSAFKWSFHHYVDYVPSPKWNRKSYAAHGGEMPTTRQPVGDWLDGYGRFVYLPGPLALALALVALAGLVVRRPADAPPTRPLAFLTLAVSLGLVLVPDLTAEFTWRYQLPLVVLLPASAALGWTRLRALRQPGTTATPSTDCPKGGVTRRSSALVQGTTTRS